MQTKIKVDANTLTVSRDSIITGERETTTYFVRNDGALGYVRIADGDKYPQVCDGLSSRGNTLMASVSTLPTVIRRELRKLIAAEKREMAF